MVDGLLPTEAKERNLRWLCKLLDANGIDYFLVRSPGPSRYAIAIDAQQRGRLYDALRARGGKEALYLQVRSRGGSTTRQPFPAVEIPYHHMTAAATVVRVAIFRSAGPMRYDMEYGVDIELWSREGDTLIAPRPNTVASEIPVRLLDERVTADIGSVRVETIEPFTNPGMAEVTFPIDVVYTWVDGNDPAWRSKMLRWRGDAEAAVHAEAVAENRFQNRHELMYSLRSLEMFAPWVNHIYLVTDQQVPAWLDTEAEGLTVVDHREIFDDVDKLPVFNSNAIISQLHRIKGLSEHYIYLNDDVFFGRPCLPELFFTSGGIAKLFPSRNLRPLADTSKEVEPHFNITTNIREMIRREFGRTISQAIKHTPHAQLRSVHEEMAERFAAEYEQTSRSRFRHHEDFAADQLFHYYAQLTGRAVPGGIRYHYVNVQDSSHRRVLEEIASRHDRDVFCLNDAPVDAEPISPEVVAQFLTTYFPFPSRFEHQAQMVAKKDG